MATSATSADADMRAAINEIPVSTSSNLIPLLPPDLWSRDYLLVPGIIGPATQLDPTRVGIIFSTTSNADTASTTLAPVFGPRASSINVSDPEKYDGTPDKLDTFLKALAIKLQFHANSFTGEPQQVAYAYSWLGSDAQKRFHSKFTNEGILSITTMLDFVSFLRLQFEDPTRRAKADAKLETLKQLNRPFLAFITEWEDLVAYSSWSAVDKDLLVHTLHNKVSGEIRSSFLSVTPPSTYQAFVTFCHEREVMYNNYQPITVPRSHPISRNGITASRFAFQQSNGVPRSFSAPRQFNPPIIQSRTPPTNRSAPEPMDLDLTSQERGPDGRITSAAREARRQLGRCYRCNQIGHRAVDCKPLLPVRNLREVSSQLHVTDAPAQFPEISSENE